MNSTTIRRALRATATALALGGVIAALSACDRNLTATVSADQTVSGQLTFSVPGSVWDASTDPSQPDVLSSAQQNAKDDVTGRLEDAFPGSPITSGRRERGDSVYETVTFTKISFADFEAGLTSIFTSNEINTGSGGTTPPAPVVDLAYDKGVYRLDATNLYLPLTPSIDGTPTSGYFNESTLFNKLTLTFPDAIASTNGVASGKTVVWDFVKNSTLDSLHVVTAATSTTPTAPQPQPVAVAAGRIITRGAVKVGHRVTVTAPVALTPGATRRYVWIVGKKTVAVTTKPSYRLKKGQAGKRLTVQVQYVKTGYVTVVRSARVGRIKR